VTLKVFNTNLSHINLTVAAFILLIYCHWQTCCGFSQLFIRALSKPRGKCFPADTWHWANRESRRLATFTFACQSLNALINPLQTGRNSVESEGEIAVTYVERRQKVIVPKWKCDSAEILAYRYVRTGWLHLRVVT